MVVKMVTRKVVPTPGWLSTSTVPPIYSMILLQMLKPRPVPCWFRFSFDSSF